MALLDFNNVSKSFGGLQVIRDFSFHVNTGEIVSIIGPNGAGKTTVFNLITGIYTPDSGDIRFEGQSLIGLEPHEICERGIARTFQLLRLFLNMSVRENVMAAAYPRTHSNLVEIIFHLPGFRREEAHVRALAEEKLGFFGERLAGTFDQPVYSLPYANRRQVEIARAMATGPKLLLLDEPAAGMNPNETQEITHLIGELRTRGGYTILLIEHDMQVVGGISDRVIALDYGEKIAEGVYHEVATNEKVIEAYLGRQHKQTAQTSGGAVEQG
jgi:ABC-type branched-subunit amino acid transport system ATPase component